MHHSTVVEVHSAGVGRLDCQQWQWHWRRTGGMAGGETPRVAGNLGSGRCELRQRSRQGGEGWRLPGGGVGVATEVLPTLSFAKL